MLLKKLPKFLKRINGLGFVGSIILIFDIYSKLLHANYWGKICLVNLRVCPSKFTDDVSSELLAVVMDNLNSLLSSKSREVVQSALALVKIIVTVFKDMSLGQFLDSLVSFCFYVTIIALFLLYLY